jgi:hypothetical protein
MWGHSELIVKGVTNGNIAVIGHYYKKKELSESKEDK